MDFMKKLSDRFNKTVSTMVSDSVKEDAKTAAATVLPTLIGIGFVVAGFAIFKSAFISTASKAVSTPTLSTTSIITNNWFFDKALQEDVIQKLINNR